MSTELLRGLPEREYHALDRCSHSRLRTLGTRSPAHMRAELEHPEADTDEKVLGRAAHLAVLQPELFEQRVIAGPTDDRRLKVWKDAEASKPEDMILLRPKDYDIALRIRDAVHAHPGARYLLDRATERELTVLWTDAESGVECKARLDLLVPELACTVEVKTAFDAARTGFERAVHNMGYATQGAFYRQAINIAQQDVVYAGHAIIAAEKEPPYAVNAFLVRDDVLKWADGQLRRWLRTYGECQRTGLWPPESNEYSLQFMDIALPAWAMRNLEESVPA